MAHHTDRLYIFFFGHHQGMDEVKPPPVVRPVHLAFNFFLDDLFLALREKAENMGAGIVHEIIQISAFHNFNQSAAGIAASPGKKYAFRRFFCLR